MGGEIKHLEGRINFKVFILKSIVIFILILANLTTNYHDPHQLIPKLLSTACVIDRQCQCKGRYEFWPICDDDGAGTCKLW